MRVIVAETRDAQPVRMGLGDMVERMAKPIAKALKLPCLDEKERLREESPCAKRRDWLNKQGRRIGIGTKGKA